MCACARACVCVCVCVCVCLCMTVCKCDVIGGSKEDGNLTYTTRTDGTWSAIQSVISDQSALQPEICTNNSNDHVMLHYLLVGRSIQTVLAL